MSAESSTAVQQQPRVVVFGEALTDFIRVETNTWRNYAGGSCWNVARVVAKLGLATGFAGAVSQDNFGDEIVKLSAEAGLDMRFMQQLPKPPLLAMVVEKHPPQYFFIGNDSADLYFDPNQLPADWLAGVELVHFGSISLTREPLASRLLALAQSVRAAGKLVSFDPNYRNLMGPEYLPTLRLMASLASYIKVSDEDLRGLFSDSTEPAALLQLRDWAPQALILYTRGEAGITLLSGDGSIEQPAFSVQLVDTVGAGDATMGGWIYSVLSWPDAELPQHLQFAAATAATVCQYAGAHPPLIGEVENMLRTHVAHVPASPKA